jgi:hypothetical protein
VAKKKDKHSRHILEALDLPELEEVEPFYDPLQDGADADLSEIEESSGIGLR